MTFSRDAWEAIAPIRTAIDDLPFLIGMQDGSLPRDSFVYYMAQDAHYLADYGRVLAVAASQAPNTDELLFWARSATSTVLVERELHAAHVADFEATTRSPTCTAYTSYLFSLAAGGQYPVLAAGILPCFWIYEDVGRRLKERVGDLSGHPYADWIGTYGDPEFAASTEQARQILDRVAAQADPSTVDRMHEAFATASRYEWMFWDAAARREVWPLAGVLSASATIAARNAATAAPRNAV
jgi:thiaminase/transcriptional activator TenA